jgi:AraC-like DNA-binding protein
MDKTLKQLWPVPVQLLGLVALELKQHGVSVGTLLSGTEVTEEFLFDSEKTLPYRTTQAILEKAVDLSPVPHLGFVIGAQQSPSGLGVLGYGINCCVNLRETIEIVRAYHRVTSTLLLSELEEDSCNFHWTATAPIELGSLLQFLVEEQFYAYIHTMEILVGEPFQITEIHVQHPKPRYSDLYDDVFRCPITYSSDRNQIVLPSDILDTPILNANPLSAKTAKRLCEDFLIANPAVDDLVLQVQQLVLQESHLRLDESTVADKMNITSRTLRNKLKKQDTGYREIVDGLREQIDKKQLVHGSLNVSNIAEQVGYSDASAFRRAFKRWTGMTPETFRNQTAG